MVDVYKDGGDEGLPLVSVVVTTHNYVRFLPEAIESVLAQDHSPLEVIVVDDGSTDATSTVMATYQSRGVTYLRQSRRGPGAARNAGLAASQGPFIAFLDADDAWLSGKLSQQVALMRAMPDLGFVAGGRLFVDERGGAIAIRPAPNEPHGRIFERLLAGNFVGNPSVALMRRSCLEAVGGFSEIPLGQDWDTFLALARRNPVGFVPRPVARVRVHSAGVSTVAWRRRADANEDILRRHIAGIEPHRRRSVARQSRAWSRLGAARLAAKAGQHRDAAWLAASALYLEPRRRPAAKLAVIARAAVPKGTRAMSVGPNRRSGG